MALDYGYQWSGNAAHFMSNLGAICGGLGALATLCVILRYKPLQKTISARLVFFQTCSYFSEAIFELTLPSSEHESCIAQAVLTEYFQMASLFWASVISFVLFSVLRGLPGTKRRQRKGYEPNAQLLMFHAICWLTPIPVVIIPMIMGDYDQAIGGDKGWCWITKDTDSGKFFRIIHYSIYWALILFIAALSGKVWCAFRQASINNITSGLVLDAGTIDAAVVAPPPPPPSPTQSLEAAMYHRLIYFPAGQIILLLPSSVFRVCEFCSYTPPYFLLVIGVFMLRSIGVLNLIVYVYQLPVQKEIARDMSRFRSWFWGDDVLVSLSPDLSRDSIMSDNSSFASTVRNSCMVHRDANFGEDSEVVRNSTLRITNESTDKEQRHRSTGFSWLQDFRNSISDLLFIPSPANGGY